MKKIDLSNALKLFGKKINKHSPEILTALGITGMITGTIMAVKSTPKAMYLIEERKKETKKDKLSAKEYVSTTWKCYIPTAITSGISVGCLICANSVSTKRNAALATAYTISETALKKYQEKVVETIGEKKEKDIREETTKEIMAQNPIQNNEIIITNSGETLFYDSFSGRYFKSDVEKIKSIINDLNKVLIEDTYISLNDFYYEIGLSNVEIGNLLGWNINKGYIKITFDAVLTEDNKPCLVIKFLNPPVYDY